MKSQDIKPWGVVGDLVFLLDSHGSAIPAKIQKVTERDYFFESIIDDIPIPFKKFSKAKVGYSGGKVFRFKSNAKAYKKAGNNLKGIIQEKMKHGLTDTAEPVSLKMDSEKDRDIIIAAMVIAMNRICKIGSARAQRVTDCAIQILDTYEPEKIMKEAYHRKNAK